ncbi:MAG: hypothetical protein JW841_06970 [Deltaproteobacteria bacterium]|nr:hypothetical protein [Deltaproteobacteria bacterium]
MYRRVGFLVTILFVSNAAAQNYDDFLHPFKKPLSSWVKQIDEARQSGDLDTAELIADAAEKTLGTGIAPLVRQRGLIARDRGQLPEAANFFELAAKLDPSSDARLEQVAALIPIGRWPEAVEVLARAFDERSISLRVDDVIVDQRIAPLVGFEPFQALIHSVRNDQSGPFGRTLQKLERIDVAVSSNKNILNIISSWIYAISRIVDYPGTAVFALWILGLLFSIGLAQTQMIPPPWSLISGMLLASGIWYFTARIATNQPYAGLMTISVALGVIFAPWGIALALRSILHRKDRRLKQEQQINENKE